MKNISKSQRIIFIIILAIVIGIICYYTYVRNTESVDITNDEEILVKTNEKTEENDGKIVVHITGAVNKGGVVTLKENSRVTDAVAAAGARGAEMGLRQAVGFVFVEVWFSCRKELFAVPDNSEICDYYHAIVRGVENGIGCVIEKRKGLLESFGAGFVAGALASFTTTLCNIFLELDQNTIRNIRQAYASIVQAGNVLLFNPNDLLLGDRIETAAVILGTGAGVLAGNTVGDMIGKTPIGAEPTIGKAVCVFCSTLVSGLISCTLLLCLDRSKFINKTITALNMYMTDDQSYRQLAADFASYAVQIADIGVDQFFCEVDRYQDIADEISTALDDDDLHEILERTFAKNSMNLPWTGRFDSFMANPQNKLVFG